MRNFLPSTYVAELALLVLLLLFTVYRLYANLNGVSSSADYFFCPFAFFCIAIFKRSRFIFFCFLLSLLSAFVRVL